MGLQSTIGMAQIITNYANNALWVTSIIKLSRLEDPGRGRVYRSSFESYFRIQTVADRLLTTQNSAVLAALTIDRILSTSGFAAC